MPALRRRCLLGALFLCCLFLATTRARAAGPVTVVRRDDPQGLARAVAAADEGDVLEVDGGTFAGPLLLDKRLTLRGTNWPVIDSGGEGNVIKVTAPGVSIEGFVIRNSGDSLDEENAGIAVEAANVTISGNRLEETLFGVYLRQAPGGVIANNEIHSKDLALARRGDPIRVWYSHDVTITGNVVTRGRDVVLWYSEQLTVRDNTVRDGRYGLHFMYCDDATITHNTLLDNSVGAFLMYSRRLHLRQNLIAGNRGPSGYGVGLKDMDDAVIENNVFLGNRVGAFLDNSPREVDSIGHFTGNVFAFNDIGVSMLPAVRHNQFSGNSFVNNHEQVQVAGGGRLGENEWSVAGRGNYWSDYAGYDADEDGIGDVPYRSQRLFENLMDRNGALRLFVYSPAVQTVDFAARAFPFVKPQPKLADGQPLMAPVWPAGVPPLPAGDSGALFLSGSAMLLLALTILFLPRWSGRRRDAAVPAQETTEAIAMNEADDVKISVRHLTKRFGTLAAVDDLSFTVRAGEAVALWGANGAGKTTALRCLLGVIPCDGEVVLAGYNVHLHDKEARRAVGFVPQELNFHDDMTVNETLTFYARLKKAAPAAQAQLLARLALGEHAQKRVGELSGGLKQRLALAVALLADPPLLILDEPTSNLDTKARDDFLALLADLKQAGKTLVFSSHRLAEIVGLADRVLVLEQGRLGLDCPPDELAQQVGWQATLRLTLPGEYIEPALEMLAAEGFVTSRNGHGIWVRVAPDHKAQPISLLTRAGVPVADFEVE